ncbi:hypothetical protein Rhopal_001824-T1 [Rhodotorula paludigena]|uniref:Uncharacterized protein n=1 Tax=Rhodotorula paludigena TaxID=86838 RepID=A0AAV5GJJ2_9BASI|nr:hypothetical protein Rhopal_001824-T1 [Rhodotorula paludigena]
MSAEGSGTSEGPRRSTRLGAKRPRDSSAGETEVEGVDGETEDDLPMAKKPRVAKKKKREKKKRSRKGKEKATTEDELDSDASHSSADETPTYEIPDEKGRIGGDTRTWLPLVGDVDKENSDAQAIFAPFPETADSRISYDLFLMLAGRTYPDPAAPVVDLPASQDALDSVRDWVSKRRSRKDEPSVILLRLPFTWAEYKDNQQKISRDELAHFVGDWRLETSDGVVMALHITNVYGRLLGDDNEALRLVKEFGDWMEMAMREKGGPWHPDRDQTRHDGVAIQADPDRQGASHLTWWSMIGYGSFIEKYDLTPELRTAKGRRFAKELAERLALTMEIQHRLLYAIDPEQYKKMREEFDTKLRDGPLCDVLPSPWLLSQGYAITHNVGSQEHCDTKDAIKLLTAMTVFGAFEGGRLTLGDLGIESEYRPGDFLWLLSRDVRHAIAPIDGVRHGLMGLWREDLIQLSSEGIDWEHIKAGKEPRFGPTSADLEAQRKADEAAIEGSSRGKPTKKAKTVKKPTRKGKERAVEDE